MEAVTDESSELGEATQPEALLETASFRTNFFFRLVFRKLP